MNCLNLRKLVDKSNDLAANNKWEGETYVVNMKIWIADNNNFTACTRLAKYYKLNDNIPDAKRMYLNALEIFPNNYGVKNNLIEIERIIEETKFIEEFTTSRECYNSGRKLTINGHHWLAMKCYLKAFSIEPILEYAVSLARGYSKLGKQDKINRLYKELMNSCLLIDKEELKFEFAELLKGWKVEQVKAYAV
jgi:tetratricopeptide (TPR) repeat protein